METSALPLFMYPSITGFLGFQQSNLGQNKRTNLRDIMNVKVLPPLDHCFIQYTAVGWLDKSLKD